MITDLALPEGAFSLCWECKSYDWALFFGLEKNHWQHFCGKGLCAGDNVKECEGFN